MSEPGVHSWAMLVAVNLPVYFLLGKLMFGGWGEFWECVTFWLQPTWMSAMLGEWDRDDRSSLKLLLFLAICAALPGIEHLALAEIGWIDCPAAVESGG